MNECSPGDMFCVDGGLLEAESARPWVTFRSVLPASRFDKRKLTDDVDVAGLVATGDIPESTVAAVAVKDPGLARCGGSCGGCDAADRDDSDVLEVALFPDITLTEFMTMLLTLWFWLCSIIIGVIWNELDKKSKSPSGIAKSNMESVRSDCALDC